MERHAITLTTCWTKKFAKFTIQRHLAPSFWSYPFHISTNRSCSSESNRKKKFQKNKKRERRGEKQEESEIKEKWKLHNRIENRVKVIRHNLTFREMTTTPSTNLVRHLYLARHFPRQKIVKINEYQCPSSKSVDCSRYTRYTIQRTPGDSKFWFVPVGLSVLLDENWCERVVMEGEIGVEVGIGRSFLGWTRRSFSDRSEELWETFEDFRWEIVACDWNNEWNEWVKVFNRVPKDLN